jgi:hypothetical protein
MEQSTNGTIVLIDRNECLELRYAPPLRADWLAKVERIQLDQIRQEQAREQQEREQQQERDQEARDD